MLMTEYARTKQKDRPLHDTYETVQQVFSIVSVDDSGIFELPNNLYSKQYKLSDVNFLGVTIEEQAAIIRWFSKVLETVPCRFSYIVANEHVDDDEFKNQMEIIQNWKDSRGINTGNNTRNDYWDER